MWNNFCKLVYHEHDKPPTEDQLLEYLKKKKESGRRTDSILEYNRSFGRVYHYLYGVEFKSTKVEEYIEMVRTVEPDSNQKSKLQHDPGICPHCGEQFAELKQHIKWRHSEKKPWKCDLCDYAHSMKNALNEHKKVVHAKESDFKFCHACNYKTPQASGLRKHIEAV